MKKVGLSEDEGIKGKHAEIVYSVLYIISLSSVDAKRIFGAVRKITTKWIKRSFASLHHKSIKPKNIILLSIILFFPLNLVFGLLF